MKKGFLLFAILLMMASEASAAEAQPGTKTAEPTLELTLGWIREKIGLYRDVRIGSAGGAAMTETYEVTRAEGCVLEIRHSETAGGTKVSTVYRFPLGDYAEFDATNCQMFSLHTRGSSVTSVQSIEGPGNTRESSNGVADHVVVFTRRKDIDNCDLQSRLKKAFDHAGELCRTADRKAQTDQTEQKKQKKQKRPKRRK